MKRNGFTLVELLAVIVILGIIASVAIYKVTSIVDNSYDSIYANNLTKMQSGANDYLLLNNIILDEGQKEMVTVDQMVDAKIMKKVYNAKNTSEACDGYVIITKTSGDYTYTPYLKCGTDYVSDGYDANKI